MVESTQTSPRVMVTACVFTIREDGSARCAVRLQSFVATVSYLYDVALPSRLAAAIQIVNTCRALAALGTRTTVFAGAVRPAECLDFYGIGPHEQFRIVPLFSRIPGRPDLSWRLRRIVGNPPADPPHIVISRGETGVDVLPRVRRLRSVAPTILVYEAHRLGFAREAERLSGRGWEAGDALPARVERTREREKLAIDAADAIVALTPGVQSALEAEFRPVCPVLVLPSGVTVGATHPVAVAPASARDIDVIYAGKLERRKGVEGLLAAMRHMPQRRLWILGGSEVQVQEHRGIAGRLGVAARVTFTGFIAPARVGDYLRRARAGVCPLATGASAISKEFTSPLKLLELMAHRVPAVATDLPTIRAIVEHNRSAILVPPDDPRALAEAIESLLENPELSERLAAAAAERAQAFSWEARARRLLDFFQTLSPRAR